MSAAFSQGTLDTLLERLAGFSAPGPGVTRFTYDAAWCDAHRWITGEARARGLDVTVDAAGNLFFHDPALRPGDLSRRVLMVGSHLDSVKHGGRYDGAYGTLAGLMLAAELRGAPGLPVVAFVTCEEEQSRFDSHMMGGRSLLGLATAAELDAVHDGGGVTWREALASARDAGCAAPLSPGERPFVPPFRAAIEIELHIEQGPALEAAKLPLGIVEHIAGYRRLCATVRGEARHSGTTPLPMRHDALAAAAEIVLAAEALAKERGEPARVSAGNAIASPGLYNVVAGGCELWLEVRHVDEPSLDRLARDLVARCTEIAARRGVGVTVEERTRQQPTSLSKALADRAEALAKERGVAYRRMPSGAAHDTMEFARAGAHALMLFVPSRGGISHSPDEFTSGPELWAGVAFARDLIAKLAAEPPA